MEHLHFELNTEPDDVVEVTLGRVTPAANVQLLDDVNYAEYRAGGRFNYHGGYVNNRSPYQVRPPHAGRWHLVVDLGGNPGILRAQSRLVRVPRLVAA